MLQATPAILGAVCSNDLRQARTALQSGSRKYVADNAVLQGVCLASCCVSLWVSRALATNPLYLEYQLQDHLRNHEAAGTYLVE